MKDLVEVLDVIVVTAIEHAEYPVSVSCEMYCSGSTTIKALMGCMCSTLFEDFFTGYLVRVVEDAEGTSIFFMWEFRWYHTHCNPALFAYAVGTWTNLVTATCADFKLALNAYTLALETILVPLVTTNAFKMMCWYISSLFIWSI